MPLPSLLRYGFIRCRKQGTATRPPNGLLSLLMCLQLRQAGASLCVVLGKSNFEKASWQRCQRLEKEILLKLAA